MMSAVDKLHKLYSSTAAPIVWARSTGVEVLNELEFRDDVQVLVLTGEGSAWSAGCCRPSASSSSRLIFN